MILLDTNALIWLEQGRPRARALSDEIGPLYVSPATFLELTFLLEVGRLRLKRGTLEALMHDTRWTIDDPPAWAWFAAAVEVCWTHDPFDRLLVAHARLRRWRLATSDERLLARLADRERVEI